MKKLSFSNLKEVKTTLLGLVFISVALFGIFKWDDINGWMFGIFAFLIVAGILMLFSPDKLISSLLTFVKTNEKTKIKDNGNS